MSATLEIPEHPVRQADFARMLGMKHNTVAGMITEGRLKPPAVTPTRQIVIREAMAQLGRDVADLDLSKLERKPAADVPAEELTGSVDKSWMRRRDLAAAEIKELQAQKLRLEAEEAAGRLVDADVVARQVEGRAVRIRERLMAMCVDVAAEMVRVRDPVEWERRMGGHIAECLHADASDDDETDDDDDA